jgi:hypothetical protein
VNLHVLLLSQLQLCSTAWPVYLALARYHAAVTVELHEYQLLPPIHISTSQLMQQLCCFSKLN